MIKIELPRLYTAQEIADLLHCHRTNIYYYTKRYNLGLRISGIYLYTVDDVAKIRTIQDERKER